MKKIFLLYALVLIAAAAIAQSSTPLDSFVITSGVVHKGFLLDDHYPEYFKFRTEEDYVLKVPYGPVSSHYFYEPPVAVKREGGKVRTLVSSDLLISRRNKGIILTSVGLGIMATGIGLIVANPADAQTYSNGNGAGVNFRGKGAVGFVMVLIAPALIITGSVIWGKASHQIEIKRMQHEIPKDL